MHPTLLPKGRGRAAIPWAILKGLKETGVTMFKLDEGVDTGAIAAQVVIPLNSKTDAAELYDLVDQAHINLVQQTFHKLNDETLTLTVQEQSAATEWPGRSPSDGEINLYGSVIDAERLVRAVTKPYPGAFVILDGEKHIIWKSKIVATETGNLCIKFRDGFLECTNWFLEDCNVG